MKKHMRGDIRNRKTVKRLALSLAALLLVIVFLLGACGKDHKKETLLASDSELAEVLDVYERAAKKQAKEEPEGLSYEIGSMELIHIARGKSHTTVFYAAEDHLTVLNFVNDEKTGSYFYVYSVYVPLTEQAMDQQVIGKVPVFNTVPANINFISNSRWWVSDSVSELERVYKGQAVDVKLELSGSGEKRYWLYCKDESGALG